MGSRPSGSSVVIWLDRLGDVDVAEVGGKAGRLAALGELLRERWQGNRALASARALSSRRAPARREAHEADAHHAHEAADAHDTADALAVTVPPGFCVTTTAYRRFLAESGLDALVTDLDRQLRSGLDESSLVSHARRLRDGIESRELDTALDGELARALSDLGGERTLYAVRSSATLEDQAEASFAGQFETILNVPASEVAAAMRRCWASLWTERAIRYRAERSIDHRSVGMAVLVQVMVPCHVAGVAFSLHPVTGADEIVVEATWGLGEALAQGEVTPDRYVLDKRTLAETQPRDLGAKAHRRVLDPSGGTRLEEVPPDQRGVPCLSPRQLARVGQLTVDLERRLGHPQDVEWGFRGGRLYLFQARPVTTRAATSVFTDVLPADDASWTSGFLEERFPEPLSPLGWSVVRGGFEEFALRDPLRFLGCTDLEGLPLTKLYRGHPYVNVEVFRRLYKLFPDALLPEDAWRYFPGGDTASRKRAAMPSSALDPRVWVSLLRALVGDPGNWSPLHNYLAWERFVPRYDRAISDVDDVLGRDSNLDLPGILRRAAAVEEVNGQLLRIHRWSLTHADLLYTLLRRLGRLWLGRDYAAICSNLVSHLSDHSLEMDAALHRLVDRARESDEISAALRASPTLDDLSARLGGRPEGEALLNGVRGLLRRYGHRSFSLDILHPGFAADPSRLVRLLGSLLEGAAPRAQEERQNAAHRTARARLRRSALGIARWIVFDKVLALTQSYVRLRENQRFHWQKGLAALRKLYLLAGERLAAGGAIASRDDVFFLLEREIRAYARGEATAAELRRLASTRRAEYVELCAEYERSPRLSYPRFLQGGRPLSGESVGSTPGEELRGHPVSPGRARGPVQVVRSPDELPSIPPGVVLVTRGADPGWTPLFGKIAGLVMESGGQLSHGSVVAREYGIPAVVGVPNVTEVLHNGDLVLVDGDVGAVARLESTAGC